MAARKLSRNALPDDAREALRRRINREYRSESAFAEAAGIHRNNLSAVLNGTSGPSAHNLMRLASTLGVDEKDLYDAAALLRGGAPAADEPGNLPLSGRWVPRWRPDQGRPVYAMASCGDPRDRTGDDAPPETDNLRVPERAARLLDVSACFAVVVEGDSMGALFPSGAVVWADPVPPAGLRHNAVVVARTRRADGSYGGMVVKRWRRGAGPDGADCLASDRADGTQEPLECGAFTVVGVVRYAEHPVG